MMIASTLRVARRIASGRAALALCCFLAGAAAGSVSDLAAVAQDSGNGDAQVTRAQGALRSVIYAITALAVDTEIAAIEISDIKNRLDRLEVLAEEVQQSKRDP